MTHRKFFYRIVFSLMMVTVSLMFVCPVTFSAGLNLPESFDGDFTLTKPVEYYDSGNLFELIKHTLYVFKTIFIYGENYKG